MTPTVGGRRPCHTGCGRKAPWGRMGLDHMRMATPRAAARRTATASPCTSPYDGKRAITRSRGGSSPWRADGTLSCIAARGVHITPATAAPATPHRGRRGGGDIPSGMDRPGATCRIEGRLTVTSPAVEDDAAGGAPVSPHQGNDALLGGNHPDAEPGRASADDAAITHDLTWQPNSELGPGLLRMYGGRRGTRAVQVAQRWSRGRGKPLLLLVAPDATYVTQYGLRTDESGIDHRSHAPEGEQPEYEPEEAPHQLSPLREV